MTVTAPRALIDVARDYFDPSYYESQLSAPTEIDLFQHYLTIGVQDGLNPCRYFEQKWYEWQNPDYARSHETGYFHYLEVGRFEGRDPSPLADMPKIATTLGSGLPPEEQSSRILQETLGTGAGLYRDYKELEANQRAFLEQINPINIRRSPPAHPRRNLVFLQAGPSGLQSQWFNDAADRNWDMFVNLYDARTPLPEAAEYIIAQAGTKSTAMYTFLHNYADIARLYDHVLFLDDDISVTGALLNQLFDKCAEYELDAAQMALSEQSNCMWPIFFGQGSNGPRYCNGVEIMMPVLSKRLLFACRDLFGRSVSGFGLDLAIGQRAQELGENNIAVLDEVVAEHLKPIDTDGGALYSYLRSAGINPKAELWNLVQTLGLEKTFSGK